MKVDIQHLEGLEIGVLKGNRLYDRLSPERRQVFNGFLQMSSHIWVGSFDDECVAVWGVILPTLLSNSAYLWLHADEESIRENQFLFIRHSQRVIENLLKAYPVVVGLTHYDAQKSIRWLKWLGAKFGTPNGQMIPFAIRSKGLG